MTKPRRVVQFSCGAASAVAAKIVVDKHQDVEIVNAFIEEEHEDNRRFLRDVELWIGRSITVLRDEKYGASAYEVLRRSRYTKGLFGAPCSRALKRELLDRWAKPTDVPVIGYTAEEQDRADAFMDANGVGEFPLIEAGIDKAGCLALIQRAGIELPAMYRMGYHNANCIGCVKGGAGYWNKIRRDFPDRFEEMCRIEEMIGPTAYLMRERKTGRRFPLRQLDPKAGRHNAILPQCDFQCHRADALLAQRELER